VRFFVVACLTCLILSVALFAVSLSPPMAHAQACQPDLSTTSTSVVTPQPSSTSIVINEVLLLPIQSQLYCTSPLATQSQIPPGPWIELYNTLAQPLQLVHASLDSGPDTNAFTIINTSIAAHSFIVVFPSANSAFLNTSTSTLRLMLNGSSLDHVILPTLRSDTSYARIPDGGVWQTTPNTTGTTTPTIGQTNNAPITIAKPTPQPQRKPTATTKPKTVKATETNQQPSNQAQQPSSQTPSVKSQMPQLQPDWKVVRLPTRVAEAASKTPTTPDIPNTSQSPNTPDIPKKIAISLIVIALALVLWWCRKLFFKNDPMHDKPSHS
jgi:hypothetical protein